MPKPNRYQGNGKLYPEGSVMGRYVMRRGHWVDQDSPVARAAESGRKGLPGWLVVTMLALVVVFMLTALTGCQINVVHVENADIGVQLLKETAEVYQQTE